LLESAIGGEAAVGIEVELDDELDPAGLLFGEAQSRVVLSAAPDAVEALLEIMSRHAVPAAVIGRVGAPGGRFQIRVAGGSVNAPVEELARIHENAIPRRMEGTVAEVDAALHSEVALP